MLGLTGNEATCFYSKHLCVMPVNWTEVNERRISEKTQEISLYCAQKRTDMTPRGFELAQLSFEKLLDNIVERNPKAASICKSIRNSMSEGSNQVAKCSMKQAECLARDVVFNYIGDDLNLYPVSAERKLNRAKVRGLQECDIPKDEMTIKDTIFVVYAFANGEDFSKRTMRNAFSWFQEIGMDPIQARVFSYLFIKQKPLSLKELPQQALYSSKYREAAKALVKTGFISELPGELFCITETSID